MKIRDIRNLLVYSIILRTATIVAGITLKMSDQGIDELKNIEVFTNTMNPPELKVYLLMNTRETSLKIDLPTSSDLRSWGTIDLKKPLVFLIHGFLANSNETWLRKLAKAYLIRKDVNVFIVDWGTGAVTLNYFAAGSKIGPVADQLVSFIELLINITDAKASRIHLIGHSLGAHIAGIVGRKIPNLYRITGLDPAGYGFPSTSTIRLSDKDATYVDVIHTNQIFGNSERLGHVDFYVNGADGEIQPGCVDSPTTENLIEWFTGNVCSHSRAAIYFIESIKNPKCLFVATQTINEASEVRSNDFDERYHTVLGLDTFEYPARGAFYIVTNDESPYGRCSKKR